MSFVGHRQIDSADKLKELIMQCATQSPSYFFLRWTHCVSGITSDFPEDCLSPEGQVFNTTLELRWKRQGSGYNVLLLSTAQNGTEGFTAIPGDWETCDRTAHFYGKDDARFPKGFTYPDHLPIYQRYFLNAKTSTVHFVALTIAQQS